MRAQTVVQRTLDMDLINTQSFQLHVVRTTDGGTALHVMINQQDVIVKYDAALDPLWASTVPTHALGAGENGGVLAADQTGWYSAFPDTEIVFVDVHKLDASGATEWSREIGVHVNDDAYQANIGPGIWSDAAGNSFLTLSYVGGDSYVFSLDALGTPRWTTRLGGHWLEHLLPDGNGGCYALGRSTWGGADPFCVAHLDGTGQPLYFRTVDYPLQYLIQPKNMQLVGADLVLFIDHQGPASMLKLDPAGTPMTCDLYVLDPPAPVNTPFGIFGGNVMNNGEILLVGRYAGLDTKTATFRLTAAGLPLAGLSFNTQTLNNWRRGFVFYKMATAADEVTVIGERFEEDLLFQQDIHHAFLWHLPSDLSTACGAVPVTFAHQSLPVAQLDVVALADFGSNVATSNAASTAPVPHATIASNDFCVLLSATDIAAEGTDQLFTLSGQVLFAGDAFTVNIKEDVALSILDPAGRSILTLDAAKGRFEGTSTDTWGAGMYLVHARSDRGKSQAMRFLLVR
ncbi:MAG: hypothetical protein IPO12_00560 [Flavobacteriales bacterium]|nr:hypothetical protein [Flavobacteriales bacterium]